MRIPTLQIFNRGVSQLVDATARVTDIQTRIGSGSNILTSADDPIASVRINQLNQVSALNEQFSTNIASAERRLSLEDTQLDAVGKLLIRLKEITITGGNGAFSHNDRKILAGEAQSTMNEIVTIMNSKDAIGQYIFSGFKGDTKPFVDVGDNQFEYQGDEGNKELKIAPGSNINIGDHGKELFVDIPSFNKTFYTEASSINTSAPAATILSNGVTDQEAYDEFYPDDLIISFGADASTYTVTRKSDGQIIEGYEDKPYDANTQITIEGTSFTISGAPAANDTFYIQSTAKQGLLTTLDKLITGLNDLDDNAPDQALLDALLSETLENISLAELNVVNFRATVGQRLNALEGTKLIQESVELTNRKVLSDIQDLDYTQAITDLNLQTIVLQAAQQSFTKISNLTLFNFMR